MKSNAAIRAGEYWRLLTPVFLHGSAIHLLVNSLSLHNLGPTSEQLWGRKRFLAVYLASGESGCERSGVKSQDPSVGILVSSVGLVPKTR